jgi:hypothetical protein
LLVVIKVLAEVRLNNLTPNLVHFVLFQLPYIRVIKMDKILFRKIEVITEPECTAMASISIISFVEQDKPRAKKENSKMNHRKFDEA